MKDNSKLKVESNDSLILACKEVMTELNPQYLIVTLSQDGLMIMDRSLKIHTIPTFAKEVYDVSGAGDTVISVLTLCLANGLNIIQSAEIANHAAGAVCGKIGISPILPVDILNSYKSYTKSRD